MFLKSVCDKIPLLYCGPPLPKGETFQNPVFAQNGK